MAAPQDTVGVVISWIARQLRSRFDLHAKDLNLTRAQWRTIACVRRKPGATQREIARMLEVGDATAGRSIDRLCEAGWVERRSDPSDRRSYQVFPTDALAPIVGRLATIGAEEESIALAGFTAQERREFRQMLDRISRNLGR
jgi:MarR family transcriptional regulator, transcriptional regulator for hemolysin